VKFCKYILFLSLFLNFIFVVAVSVKLYLRKNVSRRIDIVSDTYWRDKVSLYKILNKNSSGGVFFVGDSMIERFKVKEFFPELPVFNRGNAWDDTQSLLARLEDSVSSGHPSAVILYVGGNDIYYNINTEVTLENIQLIIQKLETQETHVTILSILPVWHENKRKNKDIVSLNFKIKQLCAKLDAHYVDIVDVFTAPSGELKRNLSTDGVHLNGDGYKLFAAAIEPFLGQGYEFLSQPAVYQK